jgi:hypothetical protein
MPTSQDHTSQDRTSQDRNSENLSFDSWMRRRTSSVPSSISSSISGSNRSNSNPSSSVPRSNAIAKASLSKPLTPPVQPPQPQRDVFRPIRQWLDQIEVKDAAIAHRLCRFIPSQCPFERDVNLFGRTLFHIPPLCKFNPVYDEVVALRFRAICYLADVCGEDVTPYC